MRKLIAMAALTVAVTSLGSVANAGEVTGGPKSKATAGPSHANSICVFSGQEDGWMFIGVIDGVPQFVQVPTGPGYVQTPHGEGGFVHEPGLPGTSCRGGSNFGRQ
jgi:hypothetical protein